MMKNIISASLLLCMTIAAQANTSAFTIETVELQTDTCSGAFIAHELPHTTSVAAEVVTMFASNGSGLAVNDLNRDGLLDIALANLDGPEQVLWNDGALQFRAQPLNIPGRTRAAATVDVDADEDLDIAFTTQGGSVIVLRNEGDEQFERVTLPGVIHPAYAMAWGDLNNDGDLDLVTGSYDIELAQLSNGASMFEAGVGVYFYDNDAGNFDATQLVAEAQALAIFLTDLSGDQRPDIAVGNDFALPDSYFTQVDGQWQPFAPFQTITHSTMSFDAADIDNDGQAEFYATDMHPYSEDPDTMAQWEPVMEQMMSVPVLPGDPQVMLNVLQQLDPQTYDEIGAAAGVEATGWSWSGKFGDLDSDGLLDLYVVNGMIAMDLFGHLPDGELVEENQAFRNMGAANFVPATDWGLNVTESGRGMSMADMDGDGDLDIVVNNLEAPAQLYENQLCGGDNLLVSLHQPGTANPYAIGARIELTTNDATLTRDIRAMSGYLSGDAAQAHFGYPSGASLVTLNIHWPDGTMSSLADVPSNAHITITRSIE